MDNTEHEQLISVAHEMADAARAAILPFFRNKTLTADNKLTGGFDPVTEADRAAEQAMRAVLAQHRPNDAILGEEFGETSGTTGYQWVLDPIDGTRAFISGTPTWGVLIALSDANGPIYGIIDQPYTRERFEGGLGIARMMGPFDTVELSTRNVPLQDATLMTTFPEVGTPADRAGFERIAQEVRLVRYGMDCYAYALLAAGHIDLVIEAGLNPYDVQAPIAVIQAAGGIVTDWKGGPAHNGGRLVAAANAQLHARVLEILSKMD